MKKIKFFGFDMDYTLAGASRQPVCFLFYNFTVFPLD